MADDDSMMFTTGIFQAMPVAQPGTQGKRSAPPLELIKRLRRELLQVLDDLKYERREDYTLRVTKLANSFIKLSEDSADAALGIMLLDKDSRYTLLHPAMCAVICTLIGKKLAYDTDRLRSLVSAALTQNIGMYEIQEDLANQTEPLSEDQREDVQRHPDVSVEILKRVGITDELWLKIVHMHHERPNGTGYPQGLSGDRIIEEARLVSLADIYAAMILPRHYRDGIYVQQAMRKIFMQRGETVDTNMAQLFIKEMGVFPPGCFVKLANGDIGVVIQRSRESARNPTVCVLVNGKGQRYKENTIRNTGEHERFAVIGIIAKPRGIEFSPSSF